jgi:hypothetical protein
MHICVCSCHHPARARARGACVALLNTAVIPAATDRRGSASRHQEGDARHRAPLAPTPPHPSTPAANSQKKTLRQPVPPSPAPVPPPAARRCNTLHTSAPRPDLPGHARDTYADAAAQPLSATSRWTTPTASCTACVGMTAFPPCITTRMIVPVDRDPHSLAVSSSSTVRPLIPNDRTQPTWPMGSPQTT